MRITLSRRGLIAGAFVVAGVTSGSVALASSAGTGHRPLSAEARLVDKDGHRVGTIVLQQEHGEVMVSGRVAGLAPGFHGFHVHSVGVCDPGAVDASGAPSPFFSAGGHFSPAAMNHGDHAGDMPSLLVNRDGTASARFPTDRFKLASLFDNDGSAVIVHAGPDNFANIPARYQATGATAPGPDEMTLSTGDSGARFACGVVRRTHRG